MVGNKPNFEEEDIIRTFLIMGETPVSRSCLVKKTGLGEGSIRTILDILKGRELLSSKKKGHYLSAQGLQKKAAMEEIIPEMKRLKLKTYKGMKSCGLLMRKTGDIKIGFEQRDEAIRKGAYSAIIFRHDDDIKVPGVEIDFRNDYADDYNEIKKSFKFTKNEILIVTFAEDYRVCENSAIAVADKIKRIKI